MSWTACQVYIQDKVPFSALEDLIKTHLTKKPFKVMILPSFLPEQLVNGRYICRVEEKDSRTRDESIGSQFLSLMNKLRSWYLKTIPPSSAGDMLYLIDYLYANQERNILTWISSCAVILLPLSSSLGKYFRCSESVNEYLYVLDYQNLIDKTSESLTQVFEKYKLYLNVVEESFLQSANDEENLVWQIRITKDNDSKKCRAICNVLEECITIMQAEFLKAGFQLADSIWEIFYHIIKSISNMPPVEVKLYQVQQSSAYMYFIFKIRSEFLSMPEDYYIIVAPTLYPDYQRAFLEVFWSGHTVRPLITASEFLRWVVSEKKCLRRRS